MKLFVVNSRQMSHLSIYEREEDARDMKHELWLAGAEDTEIESVDEKDLNEKEKAWLNKA